MFKKYKSWYDLSFKEAEMLEKEFISHDMGRDANDAMHLCIIAGIFTFVLSAIIMGIMFVCNNINVYLFVITLLFVILGMVIVVMGTIEYHIKFNSWLKETKSIIKK